MTPRERVRTALDHREPDRVPVDLGGWQSGISYETYEPLKELLGIDEPTSIEERVQGLAWVDEPVLRRFGVDTRYVFPRGSRGDGTISKPDDRFVDEWGIEWFRPVDSYYYDIFSAPLRVSTRAGIDAHRWPAGIGREREAQLKREAEGISRGGYALFTCLAGVFEQATYLRGMDRLFIDLIQDPGYFRTLLEKVLQVEMDMYAPFFDAVGDRLDVVQYWGDLGSQQGPLISPAHYREYVKPLEAELVRFTKSRTGARVCLHSCGAVAEFIPDLIDAGYDVLNPVQTTARGMDPVRLKREFGKDMVFWGGVDTQRTLPFGTKTDIRAAVENLIGALGAGGGYILAPCHNIQALTPPENVIAAFEAARDAGVYPISTRGGA
jgi:uroporphyrinogen decarboxylase